MRFIDLFAGLGGFHLALKQLGHNCVFVSEIDTELRKLYEKNFEIKPEGDIRYVDIPKIPVHEILCAGFPCQPFSKAGRQDGLNDPELGELYKYILEVIKHHHPKYFILENVPNFEMHDDKQTWKHVKSLLENEDYFVAIKKLSPHQFGIPQIRERVYIVGSTESLDKFKWPTPTSNSTLRVEEYLNQNPEGARKLPDYINKCLDVWQEFLDKVPSDEKIPHPLWSMEFGATYPFEDTTPSKMSIDELKLYRGTHGQPLSDATDRQQLFSLLPSHARRDQVVFPHWKIKFIRKNRDFYERHKNWLDEWIPKIHKFPSSLQKLEWNCQTETNRNIRGYILQIRPSGVRVKRRTTIPSLVAMTSTQVPIIAWENRYVTPVECKRLQSMDGANGLKLLPKSTSKAYEALGNAINVEVAKLVAGSLVGEEKIPQNDARDLRQAPILVEMPLGEGV
jgi:DNA (cytosine-5)-methyltransferase 1